MGLWALTIGGFRVAQFGGWRALGIWRGAVRVLWALVRRRDCRWRLGRLGSESFCAHCSGPQLGGGPDMGSPTRTRRIADWLAADVARLRRGPRPRLATSHRSGNFAATVQVCNQKNCEPPTERPLAKSRWDGKAPSCGEGEPSNHRARHRAVGAPRKYSKKVGGAQYSG